MTDLKDPFNPETGEFAENIRKVIDGDDTELEQSLKKFGWIEHLPAFKDENDVVIVGHRRLRIAERLKIESVIKTLRFGKGDEADADRLKLAIASNLGSKPLTAGDRKRLAQYLYGKDEWTMQRIANALNVSKKTISQDLDELLPEVTIKKPAKTASNPKGAGRPKGSGGKKRETPVLDKAREIVRPLIEAGEPVPSRKLQDEHGISHVHFETAIAVEKSRKEEPPIDASTLSMTAQQKLDVAIKQATRRLEVDIERRVRAESAKWFEKLTEEYREKEKQYNSVLSQRKGIMKRAEYRSILSCLHPDRVQDAELKKRYEHAFNLFTRMEKLLLDEKESPTTANSLPDTVEELRKRRAEYQAQQAATRAAKRKGNSNVTTH